MTKDKLPLGRETDYPREYAPEVLFPIARSESRAPLGLDRHQPFTGVDTWNAWELTWLGPGDLPRVATATITVPADSPNLIESKSLKLYLNSFSMSRFDTPRAVEETIRRDLGAAAGANVSARVRTLSDDDEWRIARLPGRCLDDLDVRCEDWEVNATLLGSNDGDIVEEELHTHLLRSLCPVTAQPDIGSLLVSYRGPRMDPAGLLRYIVSYREHNDFHEVCIENMFVDILQRCRPEQLSLHARYQRRGGIDINPYRSNTGSAPADLRLWRQ